jgi:hypothetical protein
MRAAFIPMYKKIMRTEPAPASLPGSASLVLDMNVLNLHLAVQGLLSLALRVSDIVPELSGGDVLEEHLVDLLEGAVGRLGLVEEEVDPGQDGEGAEDEGRLGAEVGLVGVEDEGQHECCHMVKKPCWMVLDKRDGLDAQAGRRRLGDDGVRDGADGESCTRSCTAPSATRSPARPSGSSSACRARP